MKIVERGNCGKEKVPEDINPEQEAVFRSKEPNFLEGRAIQGLYSAKDHCQSFWMLKVKVDLAVFQREVSEISFQDQKEKPK